MQCFVNGAREGIGMAEWKFLTNHGAILALMARHGQITARDMAAWLGITERSVHRIIGDLEQAGYVVKARDGRVNRYAVDHDMPMRRPEAREMAVGDLLKVLVGAMSDGPPSGAENADNKEGG